MPTSTVKNIKITGGDKYKAVLAKIAEQHVGVRVGILEGATTTDGESIAQYAAANEFGAKITIPEHTNLMPFKEIKSTGKLKMAKRKSATVLLEGKVKEHEIIIPSRPFLRQTVEKQKDKWCRGIAADLGKNPDEAKSVLYRAGEVMHKDVIDEIQSGDFLENAPATIRAKEKKGKGEAAHPLIDTGQMMEAVSYEVVKT